MRAHTTSVCLTAGAFGLDGGMLSGLTMLNLDTEDWGDIFIGCAGRVPRKGYPAGLAPGLWDPVGSQPWSTAPCHCWLPGTCMRGSERLGGWLITGRLRLSLPVCASA